MSRHTRPGLRIAIIAIASLALALALAAAATPAVAAGNADQASPRAAKVGQQKPAEAGTFLVQLAEPPVVAYQGGVRGLRATKPSRGDKINPASPDVVRYVEHLTRGHEAALARAGGGNKLYNYVYSFNGFAAELSATAAAKMASLDGVLAVTADEVLTTDTATTPDFLGLSEPDGLWAQLGGPQGGKRSPGAGEDVIVGIIDGGIWPEHPSVADRDAQGKRVYQQIPGWNGRCVPGEDFPASSCNQKLIGARYYNAGWGGDAGIDASLPWEFNSPRDYGGHGTHTATTAAGNYGVQTTGPAAVFGTMSGMAPRARIAAYKVCWETGEGGGTGGSCFTSDSVAAIDQAVADGVDVLNFSISGTRTSFRDPVEIAFLFAADAGVFVAASAGNSGPATSTVAHPGPWLTTVAAGTHDRDGRGSVTLGNEATYQGASLATAVGPAPLLDSVDAGLAGANANEVELCFPGTLDPAVVTDAIVICKRGVIARTDKSLAVQQAGGVGMVLYNSPDSSLNADFHFVPSVHVNQSDGAAIKAYAATPGATATINAAEVVTDAPAPFTASFSSRGPLLASGDLLKPDLIAPGQDVLAGVAPPGNASRLFDLYSGTSMSSPHVAGLGALLIDLHPDWSPAAVKSALMTTGYDVLDGGTPAPSNNPTLIFRQGAGHVAPNKAASPGLVFDAGWDDWLGFLCGTQLPESFCTSSGVDVLDPSDYNSPSLAIGDLAGSQTVTRTVTNVSDASSTYTATPSAAGLSIGVSPTSFTLAPGETTQVEITVARTTAELNAYTGGQITWSDGTHTVRIPVVAKPVALAAPAEVSGAGDLEYEVTFGYTGSFNATARGPVPADLTSGSVDQDPDQTFDPGQTEGTVKTEVSVPAGTTYARFALFDADVSAGTDLDLYVYRGPTLVGSSAGGTSAEEVNLTNPAAGNYTVYVHGWGVAGGTTSPFALHTWDLGSDPGPMTVSAPTSATLGTTGEIGLSFTGLDSATKYLGSVAYGGVSGLPGPTIVRIDTP
jgi:hypothetical protein